MTGAARSFVIICGVVLLTAVAVIGGLFVILKTSNQSERNYAKILDTQRLVKDVRQIARDSEQTLKVIRAVTGCEAADTPDQCNARLALVSKEEGVQRVAEVDCRTRRAIAGLPPIPPEERCRL